MTKISIIPKTRVFKQLLELSIDEGIVCRRSELLSLIEYIFDMGAKITSDR